MRLHTCSNGVEILCELGRKSANDFLVRYRGRGRVRTPMHLDWIIDLYIKKAHDPPRTDSFVYKLGSINHWVTAAKSYPPTLQVFRSDQPYTSSDGKVRFDPLSDYGDYSVEFLLVVIELLMIQEKTNYPSGTRIRELLQAFQQEDIFRVVRLATLRRAE
jgi:hypothetical protein